MSIRVSDLTIRAGLVIVTVDGFDYQGKWVGGTAGALVDLPGIDPPGSANYLCESYGMGEEDHTGPGILHTDYEAGGNSPWTFSVLLDADESQEFQAVAREAGYAILDVAEITEPIRFGDGGGTIEILKHRNGWAIVSI